MAQRTKLSDEERKEHRKANTRRWYEKLKSDPERYIARMERGEEYAKKHRRHLKAKKRKADKARHKRIMADPDAHERRKQMHNERHRIRMATDPAYAEKHREAGREAYARMKEKMAEDPSLREKYNEEARLRQRAHRDFMKATPEGREVLREHGREAARRVMADPERNESRKAYLREYARKYRQTEQFKAKKEKERKAREKKARRRAYCKANADMIRATRKKYEETHPEQVKARNKRHNERRKIRRRTDPAFSAHERAKSRERKKRRAERQGREYKPRLNRRCPDWVCPCNALDKKSAFLRNNMSDDAKRSADAFHRDQCIENREYREGHNLC